MRAFLIKIVVIGCLHCVGGVLLYRGWAINKLPILESDLLATYLPFLIALIAYGAVFWSSGFLQTKPVLRLAIMLGFSLLAACLSFSLYMLIALNTYGS
jgi:hypothetical protein